MKIVNRYVRLFALVVVLAFIVTACGGDDSEPAATKAPAQPPAAPTVAATPTPVPPTPTPQPRVGGTFNTRLPTDPVNWDPHIRRSNDTLTRSQPLISNLVRFGAYNEKSIEPDIAESYQTSSDGTTWTFKIRQGVKWHDGTALTADDVVHSLLPMSKRSSFTPLLVGVFASVDTVTAPDSSTVVVKLSKPTLVFFNGLLSTHAVVLPKHLGDNFDKTPIGSGPFKLGSIKPSNVTSLVKHTEYYAKGMPYLDQIDYYTIADNAATVAAFITGRLHWPGVAPAVVNPSNEKQVRDAIPGVTLNKAPSGTYYSLLKQTAPFTDARVRRAIRLVYDRPEFVQVALAGDGNPYNVDILPSSSIWAMPAEEAKLLPGWRLPKDQDLAEARSLMQQAGYSDSNKLVTRMHTLAPNFDQQAAVAATQLRKIFIDARVEALDGATSAARRASGDFEIIFLSAAGTIDDPAGTYARFYLPGVTDNWSKFDLPDINRLYDEQDRIIDVNARVRKVRELQLAAIELGWWTMLGETQRVSPVPPQVRQFPPGLLGVNANLFRFEQVWLAS